MNYFPETKGRYTKVPSSHILYLFQVRSGFAYRTEQFHFSFTVALIASNPGARSLRGFFSQETGFCSERYELLSLKQKGRYTKYHPLISFTCFRFGQALPQNRTVPFFFYGSFDGFKSGARSLRGFFHRKLDSVPERYELLSWNKKDGTQSTILSYRFTCFRFGQALPTEPNSSIFLLQ